MNKISIIIPILNEADSIGRLLQYLIQYSDSKNIQEIIVVDGGSSDDSLHIVKNYAQVILLDSEKGRAKQMNAGAKIATGAVLYFLHVDSFPPVDFDSLILKEVKAKNKAGCFKMKFDYWHPVLYVSQWFTRFNHISCRGGDQSLFVTKELFAEIGGYNEAYVIYEDNEIIKQLYTKNQFVVIPKNIITSARRYRDNGVWCLHYHFTIIHLKRRLGASPHQLVTYYKKHIK